MNFKRIFTLVLMIVLAIILSASKQIIGKENNSDSIIDPAATYILIDSDDDFGTYGFPGTGTLENPFRISADVDRSYLEGIIVRDTTKHFVIQNSFFSWWDPAGERGILVWDVAPGTCKIKNCYFYCSWYTMSIRNTAGVVIEGSTMIGDMILENVDNIHLKNNEHTNGFLEMEYLTNLTIENCTFTGADWIDWGGISLEYSENAELIDCSFQNFELGLSIDDSEYVDVNNCDFRNNREMGLKFDSTHNSTIRDCFFYNNSNDGLELFYSHNSIIRNNLFYKNQGYGIDVKYFCRDNKIFHNNFTDNTFTQYEVSKNTPQAFDDRNNENLWYNPTVNEGNWWSNWDGDERGYNVGQNTWDPYPLGKRPKPTEETDETKMDSVLNISGVLMSLSIVQIIIKSKKKGRI